MPVASVRLPQMGEGLQEALLVEFLKRPGDWIRRDEPIYVMETDKAVTEVESPFEGRLIEWSVETGSVLPIGTEVAKMEIGEAVSTSEPTSIPTHGLTQESESHEEDNSASDSSDAESGVTIPPRTRKYLKEKGLLGVCRQIPVKGTKMMPEDVDRYLANADQASESQSQPKDYEDLAVPKTQITLNYRMTRSNQSTVPVALNMEVDWSALDAARQTVKQKGGGESAFVMMLWCVAKTLGKHPKFRTAIIDEGKTYRTYQRTNFGIAVALPGDALVTAAIKAAESLSRQEFNQVVLKQIELARQGHDQADETLTFGVSNIGSASMRWGLPTIVAPAVATLALGEVFDAPVPDPVLGFRFQKRAQLTLSFDHRVINGVGAAEFLNDLKRHIESFRLEETPS